MPMPKPMMDENHTDFMERCMGDSMMNEDYTDSAQRMAVCQVQWDNRDKAKKPALVKQMSSPFEIKDLSDNGSFEGLASVYGNVDLGGDIVLPGSFKEFVTTADGSIRILDGHNSRYPIGKGKVTDTHLGLAIKGKLNLAVSYARNVYELMKDGIIDGLSIGYDILPGGDEMRQDGVRLLKKLKLWEVSTTVFPMNPLALVSGVKAVEPVRTIRELEDLLRDAAGLSRAQAKLHAGAIWKTLTGQREADGEDSEALQRIIARIRAFGS